MKARPILFSAPMVRAMLDVRKTQTRRAIKLPRWAEEVNEDNEFELDGEPEWPHAIARKTGCLSAIECPYGEPGDLLWVRETFQPIFANGFDQDSDPYPNYKTGFGYKVNYVADNGRIEWMDGDDEITARCSPAIHMPRWASRLTLRITEVRVQRLQEISEDDAGSEGCPIPFEKRRQYADRNDTAVAWFCGLWNTINGPDSWDANPWVWALSFEVIKANVDDVLKLEQA